MRNACATPSERLSNRASISLAAAAALLLWAAPGGLSAQTLPPAFRDKVVFSGLTQPTAIAFASDGRVFVAEKSGLIKVFASLSATTPTVFADLRFNVYNFWDRGLLGLALHPNFPATPYVYVLYSYNAVIGGTPPRWPGGDGTDDPCPSPPGATGSGGCVISGRLSRLQAVGDVMAGPEQVLVEDWFQQFPSHSIGSIVFGGDGALYATGGDGASFGFADYGQTGIPLNPGGDPPVPVGGTQTVPTAEGGALRSQDLKTTTGVDPVTLAGTLIRIDPDTGAGLPTNPLAASPDANARRVVAFGFRNPFRMTARPGTNELWVGDVGWNTWEEINRVQSTSNLTNFGWPCYEGAGRQTSYDNLNLNLCENLYSEGAGAVTSPYYTYNHSVKVIPGEACGTGSSSITGLAFYTGTAYPATYHNALFFADYARQCIWAILPDAGGNPNPATRQTFIVGAGSPVQLTAGPVGDIFYADINGGKIHRIQYFVPNAVIVANPPSGAAPLTVNLDGSGSSHPDPTEILSYSWDLNNDGTFGDATTAQTSRTFTSPGNYTVRLRVSDTHGGVDTETVVIPVDNAPPVPTILTPQPTLTWKVDDPITFTGSATDAQDGTLSASHLSWVVLMHHCPSDCHLHTIQTFNGTAGSSIAAPDHEYPSYLELKLTATDSGGLQGTASVLLFPQTVSLNFATNPSGLELSWDSTSGPAPFSNTVIIGSDNSVSAPSPQVLNGSSYEFVSWSDGGAGSHNVIAPASAATYTATFVLQPPPSAVQASPSSVVGGSSSTGTVTLSGPAPPSGAIVALSSSNAPVASVPASVTVLAGATSANFLITTSSVSANTPVTISAFYGAGNANGTLTVTVPPNLPPTVSLTSPSSGATFIAPASINLEASVADTDGTVTRVDFYSNGTLIGTDLSAPFSFAWTNVGVGSYSLTARATDDDLATATSTPIPVTVTSSSNPLPPPWTSQEVGSVGLPGGATYFNGTYTVTGSGADIGGTSDQFHFAWQQLSGDGQIVARITGVQNTSTDAKGGVMIRESLTSNSKHAAMVITGGSRLMYARRVTDGATTSYLQTTQATPYWVKLVRSGDLFTAFRSSNGVAWTLWGSYAIPMSANVYIGLVMTSHNNTVTGTATLDNVSLVTGPPNAPPSVSITSPSNGASFTDPPNITISASPLDSDGTIAKVEFFNGATLLGTVTSPPYNFLWNTPPPGSHSLTARATDNLGAVATSAAVGISVSYSGTPLPSPWIHGDVGAVGLPGDATFSAGTFTVTGSGADIGGTSDQFHFAYQPFSGDVQVVARIVSVQNTDAKGGIMIRESLAANSKHVAMLINLGNRLMFARRVSAGATTSYLQTTVASPYWVKLVRSGDNFSAYRSTNGTTWTLWGTYSIPMGTTVYVGLSASSHNNAVTGTATLSNVTVGLP